MAQRGEEPGAGPAWHTPHVLAMNFANPAIAAIKLECEGPRLDGIQLCQSNPTIQTAMQNYFPSCGGH